MAELMSIHEEDEVIDVDDFETAKAKEKASILLEMFPDVQTTFVEAVSAEHAMDDDGFKLFIENTMLSGNYPTKNDENQLKSVETNNNVPLEVPSTSFHSFLKKYPDPLKHFSRENPQDIRHIQYAREYLLIRHRKKSMIHINRILKAKQYNLFLSDVELHKAPSSRKTPRRPNEVKSTSLETSKVALRDMIFFIENQKDIQVYLNDNLLARQKAVEEARLANGLFTCGCCYDDDLLVEEVSNCTEGHIFCKNCILRSSEVNLGDGKLDFPCLQDCHGYFDESVLKYVLPETSYEKLERKLQEREVISANITGLFQCPFCEYCAIPSEETRIFNCENCKKQSCRLCRKDSHIPLKCSEVDDERTKGRTFVEEKMTEALLRTCWRCERKFIRLDGCNKMVCICMAVMCYICRKPIKGYNHFYDQHVKNPPSNKCPLWSNNRLHEREVDEERRKAIEDLKRKNPYFDDDIFKKKLK